MSSAIRSHVKYIIAETSFVWEEKGGYYFRQYPLVDNGVLVDNETKGKAIRKAISTGLQALPA